MKIIFIRPKPCENTIGLQHLMIVEPLELEILATLVKKKHEVSIYDMILEEQSFDHILVKNKPDILCFTGYITHIPSIISHCKKAKEVLPGVITIVGGVHFEKFPEDIDSDYIDYRIVRNATRSFPALLDFIDGSGSFPEGVLEKHEILEFAQLPEFDFYVPIPDRSLTGRYRKKYFYVFHEKVALLKTSFGCPYQCKFCFCRQITGGNYHERNMDEVFKELKGINEKEIYIVDDDFLLNASRVQSFIHQLKAQKLDKHFLVYGRADFIASNPEIIRDFKKAGLRTVIVGLESFRNTDLESYNKKTSDKINVQALKVLNRFKVDCYAAVIIPPDWDSSDFQKAAKIMKKLKIKFVNLQPLTPLKGTQMQYDDDKLVVDRSDFARWDLAHVVIRPEKMQLIDFYRNIIQLYEKVILDPGNLVSHLKYPIRMQLKMSKGIRRVKKQYKTLIANC